MTVHSFYLFSRIGKYQDVSAGNSLHVAAMANDVAMLKYVLESKLLNPHCATMINELIFDLKLEISSF